MAKRFCTVEDVKLFANAAPSYADLSSPDPQITRIIEHTTSKICAFTRRSWEYGFYEEYINLIDIDWDMQPEHRFQTFHLSNKPVRSQPAAPVIDYTLYGGNYLAAGLRTSFQRLDAKDYRIDYENSAITLLLAYSPQLPKALRVRYYGGYERDAEDNDLVLVDSFLREACAMQAAFTYSRIANETIGMKKRSDKSGSVEFDVLASGFIRDVHTMLMPHVKHLTGRP
jgi:hypothetical protein